MNIKRFKAIICYMRALLLWFHCGIKGGGFHRDNFCPHRYVEVREFRENIFVKPKGKIRIADSYTHDIDEKFVYQAYLTGLECKCCGHKELEYRTQENLPHI